jgi:hypothetical protein
VEVDLVLFWKRQDSQAVDVQNAIHESGKQFLGWRATVGDSPRKTVVSIVLLVNRTKRLPVFRTNWGSRRPLEAHTRVVGDERLRGEEAQGNEVVDAPPEDGDVA